MYAGMLSDPERSLVKAQKNPALREMKLMVTKQVEIEHDSYEWEAWSILADFEESQKEKPTIDVKFPEEA